MAGAGDGASGSRSLAVTVTAAATAEEGHVVVCISAVDNHYLQLAYARQLYRAGDLVWERRFAVSGCSA